jgi:hypothetical protein
MVLDVFGVGERIAAQIVLRFAPAATSNQVPQRKFLSAAISSRFFQLFFSIE